MWDIFKIHGKSGRDLKRRVPKTSGDEILSSLQLSLDTLLPLTCDKKVFKGKDDNVTKTL